MELAPLAFIGLGNPGKAYANNRHNIGFLVVEAFAKELERSFKQSDYLNSRVAKGKESGHPIYLVMPQTYMNESGWAARRCLAYYELEIEQLVIVCDDAALEFGQLRLRSQGSSGGHNGLKSIETHLGTNQFIRLRMGIGSKGIKPLADYVLSDFSADEMPSLDDFIGRGVSVLQSLVTEPVAKVMTKVNTNNVDLGLRSGE